MHPVRRGGLGVGRVSSEQQRDYGGANLPGAGPHTSAYALTNVTLQYPLEFANRGIRAAA